MDKHFRFDPKEFSGAKIHVQLGEGGRIVSGFLRVRTGIYDPSSQEDPEASVQAVVPSLDLGRSLPGEVCFFLSSQDMRDLKRKVLDPKPEDTVRIYEYLLTIDPHRLA